MYDEDREDKVDVLQRQVDELNQCVKDLCGEINVLMIQQGLTISILIDEVAALKAKSTAA